MKANIEHKGKTGIYCIRNISNKKVYIGKAKCIWKRIHGHLSAIKLKDNTKTNEYLINSFYKYGKKNFEYFVLEYLDLDENLLKERELYWIEFYESTNKEKGYNLRKDSFTNMICHESTSIKISERLKLEWDSGIRDGHGDKLRDSWDNNPQRKIEQSKLLSKIKTKYMYDVYNTFTKVHIINCDYKKLVELNIQNCLAEFFRKKSDKIRFKSYIIKRLTIKDIV